MPKGQSLTDLRKEVENSRREKTRIEGELSAAIQKLRAAEKALTTAEFKEGMREDAVVRKAGEEMKLADREFRKTLVPPQDWVSDVPYNCSDDFADFRLLEECVEQQLTVFQALIDDLADEDIPLDSKMHHAKALSAVRLLVFISGQIAEWLAKPIDGVNDDSFGSPPSPDNMPNLKFDNSVPCVEHYGGLEGSAALLEQKDELQELWNCLTEPVDTDCDETQISAQARQHVIPVVDRFAKAIAAILGSAASGNEYFAGTLEKLAQVAQHAQ